MLPLLGSSEAEAARAGVSGGGKDVVVLLHGLGRTSRSMSRLGRELERRGYRIVNVSYRTRREPVEKLAGRVEAELERASPGPGVRVHFVGHSLGAIVARYYLKQHRPANLGRVVMLGPPNGGSELVDLLRRLPFFRHHMGPSRGQLGTDPASLPARLGPADYDLGVIAGTKSWNPLFSWLLPGPDDGMVAVARTKMEGMSDFVTVPRSHSFMMNAPDVIAQTIAFLRDGAFERGDEEPPER